MNKMKNLLLTIMSKFSLANILIALMTITLIAGVRYGITSSLYTDPQAFVSNISYGLLAYITRTAFSGFLTEYLDLKGINLNIKQLMFGFEKIQLGDTPPPKVSDKPIFKLYTAMDRDEELNPNNSLDKGKGVATTQPYTSNIPSAKTNPGPGFNVPGG